jgi:metal-responsive CopG/Arc/MetJ family transcriptional regulator
MKRGSGKKPKGRLLAVWVPGKLMPRLDQGARKEDSDRSKFVRNAIREKLARHAPRGNERSNH